MKKFTLLTFVICLFGWMSCSDNQSAPAEEATTTEPTLEELAERGEYLVTIMGCNDCHSPKRMGTKGPEIIPELMLSGYPSDRPLVEFKNPLIQQGFAMFYPDLTAAIGPWGTTFAANLTPDETGIGTWSEEQFIKAIKEGKLKGLDNGRMILPPMPLENYKEIKDEDVKAIFSYLKSINPVRNIVPSPIPPQEI